MTKQCQVLNPLWEGSKEAELRVPIIGKESVFLHLSVTFGVKYDWIIFIIMGMIDRNEFHNITLPSRPCLPFIIFG